MCCILKDIMKIYSLIKHVLSACVVRIYFLMRESIMSDDHEVNRLKRILIEIMLTGTASSYVIRHGELHNMGLVIVDLPKLCWVLTEKGHRWLDEHRS